MKSLNRYFENITYKKTVKILPSDVNIFINFCKQFHYYVYYYSSCNLHFIKRHVNEIIYPKNICEDNC